MDTTVGKKKAIITGATKGIGLSLANKFASKGFDVATCARSRKELDQWSIHMKHNYHVDVFARELDLSDKQAVINWGKSILRKWKSVDVLINNAAIFTPGNILEEEDGYLERMMQINVLSPYELCRLFIPGMIDQGSGYVFNISSIASLKPVPKGGAYAITKHAMTGLSKTLRQELLNSPIKVTTVYPGATMTGSWEGANIDENRLINPDDIAETIWAAYNMGPRSVLEELIIRPSDGDL